MNAKVFTESQKLAIESSGKTILKSCPGSGKTFVVASKMIKEMNRWKYKNKGIALLSFTNVAHEEVIRQINALSGVNKIEYPHYTGTLDSFISQFLFLPFGHLIMKCSERPALLQDYSISIKKLADTRWKKECHTNKCDILDFYIDEAGFVKHINGEHGCYVIGRKPCEVLKNSLYSKGLATYQDATIIALRLLKEYPQIGILLAKKFPMIIIDEAQDTSKYQMKVIDLLSKCGVKDIMLIGDPDQAIYEWRNADPSVFLNKFEDTEWEPKELNDNFRCSQKICNATKVFSTLSCISKASGEASLCDFKPQIIMYDKDDKESAIDYFLKLCKENSVRISPESVAVLVRGKAGLCGKDYSKIQNLWQSQEVRLFSQASYERDYKSVGKALELVEKGLFLYFISNETIINESNERENAIEKTVSLEDWRKLTFEFCKSMPNADTKLGLWKDNLNKLILVISKKYNLQVLDGAELKIKTRDNKFEDFKQQPIKNFYATSFKSEYLNSTIHAVKGRTFDAVLLLIQSRGKLTSNVINTNPIKSEEIRTAYVAMTRAKRIVAIAIPNTVKTKSLLRFPRTEWNLIDL
ncbi:ATP-dependent helicase [Clostridium sp. A1-XYC3]|uniref:DNA 3'-5' helicase n=1 Tax=Clostridium tanneri TaxID=3037988 RepID=A0ABU4JWT9_9CLOT|nr:ATP-dependent helicase [Clostridium sp. A1-XYC3]MDW8802635.1 ATP-dependent helicase [Clostridium sp. A1-XYC3]